MMNETSRISRAAGVVSSATFLSRILGFARDVVIAGFFGAGMAADAFFVAFRIPNLLRRLFAEGTLSMALVPVLTDTLRQKGPGEMLQLARSALQAASAFLVLSALAGLALAPVLVRLLAPGFTEDPEKFNLTVYMARIMMPYLVCIGLVAVSMGILNTLGHFAAPALAPVLLNLAMIVAVFLTASRLSAPVTGLAMGVVAGGILQVLLQLPFLIRHGVRFWSVAGHWHPGLGRIIRLMGPAVFGAAVYQINLLVATLLASLLPQGSISYLYYADRLVQFPLGIFAIALATAVMPTLSRQASDGDLAALRLTFQQAMGLVLFITVPAMVGLMVLNEPLVRLLFQRGAFDPESTRLTASALLYYSTGLWAVAAMRIVLATCHALQDTRTPLVAGMVAVACNLVLGAGLMGPLGFRGLALASAVASVVNICLLGKGLGRRLGGFQWHDLIGSAAKTAACATAMGMAVRRLAGEVIAADAVAGPGLAAGVLGCIGAGIIFYGAMSWCFRCPELAMIRRMVNKDGSGT
jgi:putative peptidoglycan lipid II flippase